MLLKSLCWFWGFLSVWLVFGLFCPAVSQHQPHRITTGQGHQRGPKDPRQGWRPDPRPSVQLGRHSHVSGGQEAPEGSSRPPDFFMEMGSQQTDSGRDQKTHMASEKLFWSPSRLQRGTMQMPASKPRKLNWPRNWFKFHWFVCLLVLVFVYLKLTTSSLNSANTENFPRLEVSCYHQSVTVKALHGLLTVR